MDCASNISLFIFSFTQHSTPWRKQRQEFGTVQAEKLPSALEHYRDIESKNAEIERLELKVAALKNKLLKCALFMKQIEYQDIRNDEYLIPFDFNEKYGIYRGKFNTSIFSHLF